MAVDNTFVIKKIQKSECLYTVFSPLTKMPYIECDEETFDDQVYVFSTEEGVKEFVKEKNEKKIPLQPFKIPNEQIRGFLTSRYPKDFLMEEVVSYAKQQENSFLYHVYGNSVNYEEEILKIMVR